MQFTYEEALKEVMLFVDSNTTAENSYKMSCVMAVLLEGDTSLDEERENIYQDGYDDGYNRCLRDVDEAAEDAYREGYEAGLAQAHNNE